MRKIFFVLFSFSALFIAQAGPQNCKQEEVQPSASPENCLENQNIPLHEGITLYEDQGICFDGPDAQVITAVGQVPKKIQNKIKAYYQETLKELGWIQKKGSVLTFERDDQTLLITLTEKPENPTILDISISLEPKPSEK